MKISVELICDEKDSSIFKRSLVFFLWNNPAAIGWTKLEIDDEKIEILKSVAGDNEWSFRLDYSGRGMFGRLCPAIIGPGLVKIIEAAAREQICGAQYDNMGMDSVVYWPSITIEKH